ncbi:photosystem reaction center subunit H [Aureimonas sp. SA4125]|uniref:PRC-barrel domain-containing protein n=1 Tax=Aureimonas sp. SA4125 TaxID=2826993 RepID=UPI001CC3A603|nr:PRC-barrel domain-containing protein [Aureimonas sp. SA4125]BDA85893.1 photosystem reaction center subunit H [Aureimonas sp. SA4125]
MMIRKLLTTTALASVIASAAFAQATTPAAETPAATTAAPATDTMAPAATDAAPAADTAATGGSIAYMQSLSTGEHLASVLTGADVYQNDSADAESAGKIDNFLVSNDGKIVAAIIDTAGLDDDKSVAVPIDKLTWKMAENGDEPRAILAASRDELVAAPVFTALTAAEAAATAPAAGTGAATGAPAATTTAPAMGTDTAAMAPAAGTDAATTAPMATADATQSSAMGDGTYAATVGNDQFLSEDLIGENVYSGAGDDADSIGSVNDLVMADNGDIKGVVVGVGGFLGIGEKNVGVPFANLQLTKVDGDETRAIVESTKDQLTAAPSFNADAAEVAGNAGATADTTTTAANTGAAGTATGMAADTAAAPAASDTAANTATGSAMTPAAPATNMAATGTAPATDTTASTGGASDRSAMTPVTGPELTAESLVGTTVYGPNDESIGEVGDIALSAAGTVDAIIVDVGGFLGIGQKPVAVAMDNLQFMKDSGGSMYLYTQFTQDELTSAPEYNSSTYAENRDQMRIGAGGQIPQETGASTDMPAPATGTDAMTPNAAGTTPAPAQ